MTKKFLEEQFKAHLKEHNITFEKYLYYNKHRGQCYYDFNQLLEQNPYYLLIDAFKWSDTKEGHNFWSILNKKWDEIVENYLLRGIPYYTSIDKNLYND